MSQKQQKLILNKLRKDFPDLSGESYNHLCSLVSDWFNLFYSLGDKEMSESKVKAFIAQIKSSLHLSMVR